MNTGFTTIFPSRPQKNRPVERGTDVRRFEFQLLYYIAESVKSNKKAWKEFLPRHVTKTV